MSKPLPEKPIRRKATLTPYAILWSMSGAIGLGYLGVAIFAPQLLVDLTPALNRATQSETQATLARLSEDVDGLKSSMQQVGQEVASVKSDVAAQSQQTQTLSTQVSALEEKVQSGQTPVTAAAETAAQSIASAPAGASEAVAADASEPPPVKLINGDTRPIVTGSVDTGSKSKAKSATSEVISFGPAIVKPAAKPIGLLVGSDSSVDALRLSWSVLQENHGQTLKNLKPRYVENGDFNNPNFNLMAGPVKSKAEAVKICKDLIAHDVSCKVGEFKGEEL